MLSFLIEKEFKQLSRNKIITRMLVALPLMTSAQGILPAMAVYAGGILVAWVCGFIFTTLFGCRNVNLD